MTHSCQRFGSICVLDGRLLGGTASSRLIVSRHSSERNIDAVGAIDGNNRESEVYQFFLAEVRSSKSKHVVWDIAIGQ